MSSNSNYGSVNGGGGHHPNGNGSAESDALLPRKPEPARPSIRAWALEDVAKDYGDLALLVCYVVTGLLDSSATVIWGAFVSMQTGNSIYIGLGLTAPAESNRWVKSAASVACFCAGSFFFSRLHRLWRHPRRRAVIVASIGLQALMIVAAALIIHFMPATTPGDRHDLHWHVLLPVALVAFQSGGQTAVSRALQFNALTSTVLTSIYCDLFSDQDLFAGPTRNPDRNRRLAAPILLIAGAVAGGGWAKSPAGIEGALWTAAVLKLFITAAYLFWKAEPKEEPSE